MKKAIKLLGLFLLFLVTSCGKSQTSQTSVLPASETLPQTSEDIKSPVSTEEENSVTSVVSVDEIETTIKEISLPFVPEE